MVFPRLCRCSRPRADRRLRADDPSRPEGGSSPPPTTAPVEAPSLQVDVLADDLDHPWDVVQAPDGTLLVDERGGGLTAVRSGGGSLEVAADFGDLFADGETGLMGLALDPGFSDSRRFYTCQGVEEGGSREIQLIAWTMAPDWTRPPGSTTRWCPVSRSTATAAGTAAAGWPSGPTAPC